MKKTRINLIGYFRYFLHLPSSFLYIRLMIYSHHRFSSFILHSEKNNINLIPAGVNCEHEKKVNFVIFFFFYILLSFYHKSKSCDEEENFKIVDIPFQALSLSWKSCVLDCKYSIFQWMNFLCIECLTEWKTSANKQFSSSSYSFIFLFRVQQLFKLSNFSIFHELTRDNSLIRIDDGGTMTRVFAMAQTLRTYENRSLTRAYCWYWGNVKNPSRNQLDARRMSNPICYKTRWFDSWRISMSKLEPSESSWQYLESLSETKEWNFLVKMNSRLSCGGININVKVEKNTWNFFKLEILHIFVFR